MASPTQDTTDATSGVVIEADDEGFTPSQTALENVNKPIDVTSSTSSVLDDLAKGAEVSGDDAADNTAKPDATGGSDAVIPDVATDTTKQAAAKDTISALDDAIKERQQAEDAKIAKAKEEAEAAKKAEADAKAAEAAKGAEKPKAPAEEPKDKLAEVQLPPHAKPASHNAFAEIKRVAREEIAAKDKVISELQAKLPKDGQKILDPAIEKELQELREYRKAHDFVNSDEFRKQYVAPIDQNAEAIEQKLRQAGMKDEQIAKIKEIGIDRLDWDKLLAANIPAPARLSLQALLLNREQLREQHTKALEQAKSAPTEYAKKVTEAGKQREAQERAEIVAAADEVLAKVDWLKPVDIPVSASEEERKSLEERNKFAAAQKARYDSIINDRTPYTHGALVAGTIAAYQFRAERDAFKARMEAAEAELAKVKKSASTARVANSAPAGSTAPSSQPSSILKTGEEALDELRAAAESSGV
jgi:hypothetical protein